MGDDKSWNLWKVRVRHYAPVASVAVGLIAGLPWPHENAGGIRCIVTLVLLVAGIWLAVLTLRIEHPSHPKSLLAHNAGLRTRVDAFEKSAARALGSLAYALAGASKLTTVRDRVSIYFYDGAQERFVIAGRYCKDQTLRETRSTDYAANAGFIGQAWRGRAEGLNFFKRITGAGDQDWIDAATESGLTSEEANAIRMKSRVT